MEQLAGATGSIYLGPAIVVPDEDSFHVAQKQCSDFTCIKILNSCIFCYPILREFLFFIFKILSS